MSDLIDRPETHEKRTETHACDLIKRQDAVDVLKGLEFCHYMEFGEYIGEDTREVRLIRAEKALDALLKLPSAQPEIVVCADCKHWICHDRRCGYWNHGVKPLDWCCHAERRTDDKTNKSSSC